MNCVSSNICLYVTNQLVSINCKFYFLLHVKWGVLDLVFYDYQQLKRTTILSCL